MSQPNSFKPENAAINNQPNSAQKPMTDSGYESDTERCDEPPESPPRADVGPECVSDPPPASLQKAHVTERRIQIPELDGLTQFVGSVDAQTLERFQDVTERLGGPLTDYLRKGGRDCRPMAIRLMILGEDFQTARPWIIVLCPHSVNKRAKRFFQKRFAKSILEPNYPSQIRFDLAIIDQPPHPLGIMNAETSLEVYDENNTALTLLFGSFIQLQDCNRYATVGGVIKVVDDAGNSVFYGLTSGHIIDQDRLSKSRHTKQSSYSESEEDFSEYSSESSKDEHLSDGHSENEEDLASKPNSPSAQENSRAVKDIKLSNASFSNEACNHDWGLISCEDPSLLPSNLIQENHHAPLTPWRRVVGEDEKINQAVVINSGVLNGVTFSALPTFMLMPNGKKFVPVYSCSVNGTSNVSVGNSGSWIFGQNVDTVFGHIVAKDIFGDLLVVPITQTFEDIKTVLNAKEVSFPTPLELTSFSLQRPEMQFGDYCTPSPAQTQTSILLLPTSWVAISTIMFMNILAVLDITLKTYWILSSSFLWYPRRALYSMPWMMSNLKLEEVLGGLFLAGVMVSILSSLSPLEARGTHPARLICLISAGIIVLLIHIIYGSPIKDYLFWALILRGEAVRDGIFFIAVTLSIMGSSHLFDFQKMYPVRSLHFIGLVIVVVFIDLLYYSLVETHLVWAQYIPHII